MPGRPSNPKPGETRIQGAGLTVANPRVSVFERNYPWEMDARGWLTFDGVGQVTAEEKLEMLTDPHIAGLLHLRRSWVLIDGVQIVPTEGVDPMLKPGVVNPKYEKAVEAAEMCRWMLCNTADSFHAALLSWQQADFWRNMASDLIWRDQEWGDYRGKLMLDRMPVYGPNEYVIWRKQGQIIGIQPAYGQTYEDGKPKVYPLEKFALFLFRPDHRHRNGTDLATLIQIAHYMKRETQPEWLKNIAQVGSPFVYGIGPENVTQPVPLLDANGEEMKYPPGHPNAGQTRMVPPQMAMGQGIKEGFKAGGFGLFAGTSKIGLLEAQAAASGGRFFPNQFDEMHWEMAVAILGVGTLTQEQRYGSNATAKTGQEVASTTIRSDKVSLADLIKKSLCTPAVRYNMPRSYWDVVPTVTLGDPKASLWESLLSMLLNTMPADQATEMGAELSRRVGLTDVDWGRIRDIADNPEPVPGTVPGTTQGGQA